MLPACRRDMAEAPRPPQADLATCLNNLAEIHRVQGHYTKWNRLPSRRSPCGSALRARPP